MKKNSPGLGTDNVKLYFNESYCKIYHYQESNIIHLDWGNFSTTEEFRKACESSLELLVKMKSSKMLADNSKAKMVSLENQFWLTQHWFPRAVEEGFRYSAVILAQDAFMNLALDRIDRMIKDVPFTARYFTDIEKGMEWLSTLKPH